MIDYFLTLKNKSHYLCNDSKKENRFINPYTFSAQKAKQNGYFTRLYFHYKYISLLGGRTYFYTLTYNDKSLPQYLGVNCIRNSDIREFFRLSGFDKRLVRDYGYTCQYFVSCELGEGKGLRGLGNNPHYHCIIFLTPTDDKNVKNHLTDSQFYELVTEYWQGSGWRKLRPQQYKYGIAMPGDDLGLVSSAKGLNYVSKYVLKDVAYFRLYNSLKLAAKQQITDFLLDDERSVAKLEKYFNNMSFDDFNIYFDNVLNWAFHRYHRKYIMRECMPKVHISQHVGEFIIHNVNDDGLTINLPIQNTIKSVNIPLYAYRKLYYDIVKDGKGNNKYVLNDEGINLRVKNLNQSINKKFNEVKSLLTYYRIDFDDTDVYKYSVYDLIYRSRFCPSIDIPLDFHEDLAMFLNSEYYRTTYTDDKESYYKMLELSKDFHLYISHPYFQGLKNFFDKVDDLLNYHYICIDESSKANYNAVRRCKQLFSKDKFLKFVNSF